MPLLKTAFAGIALVFVCWHRESSSFVEASVTEGKMMATGRFISYLRVSTQQQGKSGLGLEAQREAVAVYLNGGRWKLVPSEMYTRSPLQLDSGVSAPE